MPLAGGVTQEPTEPDAVERQACTPVPLSLAGFNPRCVLPHGLETGHVRGAMEAFLEFLGFINEQLNSRSMPRLESFMMAANFSSLVGEFMSSNIPRFCPSLVKNRFHNGHPDLVPQGMYPRNSVQHASVGIELKASRYLRGWQGHNAEDTWLMVFCFESNTSQQGAEVNCRPQPFRFVKVVGADIVEADWNFSGRSETSRRTITASVTRSGFEKMEANWIYRASHR